MRRPTLTAAVLVLVALPLQGQERPFELEGLVVTATPTPRPVEAVASAVTVLEGADLRARGMSLVQEALREVPGVAVVQNGSYGAVTSVFMRGAESDHVLVLVDGVQMNQPGGAFDFSTLTLDNVERIEVVRGPASALYGSDAVAGVIQVVTRTGRSGLRGALSTRMGTYGRRDWSGEVSGGGDLAGYALTLSRARSDGILPFNNAHESTVLAGSVRFAPDERTWSRVSVRLSDREYHFPTDGAGVPSDRNAYTFGDESTVSTALGRSLGERVSLQLLLTVNEVDTGTDDEADGPADTLGYFGFNSLDHMRRAAADMRANIRFGGEVLTLGGELETERQRSFTESQSQYGPSSDRSAFARANRALYAHLSGARGRLALDAGVRLEDNERFGRLGTWQAGTVVRLDAGGATRARVSAGSAIKEPTFFENHATGFARGNPDLNPERATSWEVGIDHALAGGRARVSATYFDQGLRDLIQYTFVTPSPADPNFFNVAAADSRGLEVAAAARAGALSIALGWTWLATEVLDAGYDEGPGATFVEGGPLIRRPRHSASARVTWALGARGTLHGGATWVGARADRDFATYPAAAVTLPAYVDLRLGADVTLFDGRNAPASLTLTVRGENLLDEERQEVFGFAAPGRALAVGVRAGLGGGS